MDPFKKSLGINFGPLFSVAKESATRNNNSEKKNGAELSRFKHQTPGNTPKPDIDVWGGYEVIGWVWVSTSTDMQQSGYWKPILGEFVGSGLPDTPPIIPIGSGGGGSGGGGGGSPKDPPSKNDEKPCIEERTEIEERKSEGIRIIRNYKRPCGSDTWDCRETWMNTSGKNKGTGFMDKGKSNIIKIQSCFDPGIWNTTYPPTEEEKRMIRTAIEEILTLQCLEEIAPGLLECLRKEWKNTEFAMSNSSCITDPTNQGNTIPKWSNLAEKNQEYHKMALCRERLSKNGKIIYKELYSVLLHEMLHLCTSSNSMQEFDPYVLSNLCDNNAFGKGTDNIIWTNMCIGNPPWYRANSKGPTENFLTMFDKETGRILYASNLFIWDPVTGEVFKREKLSLGESYDLANNPSRLKKGKKLSIIWKCPG